MILEVAVAARRHLREGVARIGRPLGKGDDGILHVLGAVDVALARLDHRLQGVAVDLGNGAVDADVAERIARALVHREGDGVLVGRRVEVGGGRDDLEIGIAVVEVEAAQKFLVGLKLLLVVDVVAHDERQHARALGVDDVGQPGARIGVVADEIDRGNLGAVALVDVEDNVHPVVAEIHDLGRHRGVVAPDTLVGRLDRLDIGIGRRLRIDPARLHLHRVGELGVLDLLVALEQDLVDDLVFRNPDHQRRAGLVDLHVREQAGGKQRLDRLVDIGAGEGLARLDGNVVADRVVVDALVAADHDIADHRSLGGEGRRELNGERAGHRQRGRQSHRGGRAFEVDAAFIGLQNLFLEVPTARIPDFRLIFPYRINRIFPTRKASG